MCLSGDVTESAEYEQDASKTMKALKDVGGDGAKLSTMARKLQNMVGFSRVAP